MSRCWTLVVLAGALLGPQFCGGALNVCRDVPGFQLPEDNSYVSYDYTLNPMDGSCTSVTRKCGGTVPERGGSLSQRSWFINPVKDQFGRRYQDRTLEIYKIQCPLKTILHLYPQEIDVQLTTPCTGSDFVTVERGQATDSILCGTNIDQIPQLSNFGRGVLVEEGNATITFCTDQATTGFGFVIRATCINPELYQLPGCVNFQFFFDWDPQFVDLRSTVFVAPARTFQPHKRSIKMSDRIKYNALGRFLAMISERKSANFLKLMEEKKERKRNKRFVFRVIDLVAGDSATFSDFMFTVEFDNGDKEVFRAESVTSSDSVVGTKFYGNGTSGGRTFNGPAKIEINEFSVLVVEFAEPNRDNLFLPSPVEADFINRIASYIWQYYGSPYPIIDDTGADPSAIPLKSVTGSRGDFVRFSQIGLVHESVDANSTTCRRVVVEELSPARGSEIDRAINAWCRFFFYSCNPYLSAICNQAVTLDTISRN